VTAPGAVAFPRDIIVTQEGCSVAVSPNNVRAISVGRNIEITWDSVSDAVGYEVFRSRRQNFGGAELLATLDAQTLSYVVDNPGGGAGCARRSNDATSFVYWVVAANDCGQGEAAQAESEFTEGVEELVFPTALSEFGDRVLYFDGSIAIRLQAEMGVDVASITATTLAGEDFSSNEFTWVPVSELDSTDGWVVFTPTQSWLFGDLVTMTVEATTLEAESVGPIAYSFVVETEAELLARLDAPPEVIPQLVPGVDYDDTEFPGETNDEVELVLSDVVDDEPLPNAIGPIYAFATDQVFSEAQRVWVPVPAEFGAVNVAVHYRYAGGLTTAWFDGAAVNGWLVPESHLEVEVDVEGVRYVGVLMRHTGTIQLGAIEMKSAAATVGALPMWPLDGRSLGDLLVLFCLVTITVGLSRNRVHTRRS
jgi:hypothetical protein